MNYLFDYFCKSTLKYCIGLSGLWVGVEVKVLKRVEDGSIVVEANGLF